MRPGEIIDCPWCGRKHELLLSRITETCHFDGNKMVVIVLNISNPNLLYYKCGYRKLIAFAYGRNCLSLKTSWLAKLWHRIWPF
jgi:hypothetical protein